MVDREETRRRGVFYGWWLVALAGLAMLAATGPWSFHALPIWASALAQDYNGIVRSELSQAMLYPIYGGILLGPVVGYLGDRVIGIRRTVVAGLVILAGAFFFLSQAQGLWMFYAASALIAVGATMSGWILLMTLLSRWFVRRRATAIGVALMLSSLGAICLVPLIALSADPEVGGVGLGWRLTAVVLGGSIMAVAVLAFARLRDRPGDMGLLPDGGPPAVRQSSFSAIQTLRTRSFWLIVFGDGLAAIGDGLATIGVPDLTDTRLALVLSASTLGFTLVGGLVGDRVSKSAALACFTAVPVVVWTALAFVGGPSALYLSAVAMGMSRGGRSTLRVAIIADYFGTNSLPTILGLFHLFAVLIFTGAFVGFKYYTPGCIVGFLITKGNLVCFLILSAVTLLAAISFVKARAPQVPDSVAS